MSADSILTEIESLLASMPVADREAILERVENYGDMRADTVLSK